MSVVTRAQTVTDQLRRMFIDGQFGPGERLQEQKLAKMLGVSRTPVHDALAVLAKEELVTYEPNCGYVLREFQISEVLDAFDVRMVLESMACRVLAERGLSTETESELQKCIADSNEVLFHSEWNEAAQKRWFELNLVFHNTILSACGNRPLFNAVLQARAVPQIYDRAQNGRARELRLLYRREQSQEAHREHQKIFQALKDNQASRAEYLMREHIFTNREAMRRNYEELQARRSDTQPVRRRG